MAENFDAMRFIEPHEELLYSIRDEAKEYFGDEYSMERVNHDFTRDMLQKFNEVSDYERTNTNDLAPNHPVEIMPTVDGKMATDFHMSDLQDLLTDGRFMVRVAAYHDDFDPAEVDLKAVERTLHREMPSDDIDKDLTVEDYIHNLNVQRRAINSQFSDVDPLETFMAEVPIQMEDAQKYVSAFRDGVSTAYNMDEVDLHDTFIELQEHSMSFEDLNDALKADDYTHRNTSLSAFVFRSEGKGRFKIGLSNGLGVEGMKAGESAFTVEKTGSSSLPDLGVEIEDELSSQGLPVERAH